MNILITGATGSVGKQVVSNLQKKNVNIKALTSTNRKNIFGDDVEIVQGNLDYPESIDKHLKNVEVLFLILRSDGSPDRLSNNKEIVHIAEKNSVKKVVFLMDKQDDEMIDFIKHCKLNWTIVLPVEFMKNILYEWKYTINSENKIYTAFPDTPSAKIHELDVADVISKVLIENTHSKKIYVLTGPEVLTPKSIVSKIKEVYKKDIDIVLQSEEELREAWLNQGFEKDFIDYYIISLQKNPPEYTYTITNNVESVLNAPPRDFNQWLKENKNTFK